MKPEGLVTVLERTFQREQRRKRARERRFAKAVNGEAPVKFCEIERSTLPKLKNIVPK